MHDREPTRPVGYTLTELLVVVSIVGLLVAMVSPAIDGRLDALRVRTTVDRLTNDVHIARMHALRSGKRVEVRFIWDAPRRCVRSYVVKEVGAAVALRAVEVAATLVRGCLTMNNARRPLVFDARGFPHGIMARTIVAGSGSVADTIIVSQLGRILREY